MQKAQWIANRICKKLAPNNEIPIIWKAQENGKDESFSIFVEKGSIKIEAESYLAAAFGVSQALVGIKSGHIAEFLGEARPRFVLRPLAIGGNHSVQLTENMEIIIPSFFIQEELSHVELYCQRIIELGFNAILLGTDQNEANSFSKLGTFNFNEICKTFHEYGIKVILQPTFLYGVQASLENKSYVQTCVEELCNRYPHIDYLFWKSFSLDKKRILNQREIRELTLKEVIVREIKMLEEVTSCSLIFYIPVANTLSGRQQAAWMEQLCDEVNKDSIIAFSAVVGEPYEDHLAPHPFWEVLRNSPDISATRLMPIVNIGLIGQGEGLWPGFSIDLLEKFFSRMYRHCFAGAISLVNVLPREGGLLDCSLWATSQYLWRERSPRLLVETWFQAFRPDWEMTTLWEFFNGVREIMMQLSFLRSLSREAKKEIISVEECRAMAESILYRLKEMQIKVEKQRYKNSRKFQTPTVGDYLNFFTGDVQRIVQHFLQTSYPNPLNEENSKESFWASNLSNLGNGTRSAITFLDKPKRGKAGSVMELIYLENRLID